MVLKKMRAFVYGVLALTLAIPNASCQENLTLDGAHTKMQIYITQLGDCSNISIALGEESIVITGATPSLETFQSGLPKSDWIDYRKVVQVPDTVCAFIREFKPLERVNDGSKLSITGPGRKSVASEKSRKSMTISFNFDENLAFNKMYYLEWSPVGIIQEVVDLKNDNSLKASFGSTIIPLSQDETAYALAHEDYGRIKLSGFGPKLFAMVQSSSKVKLDTSSPEHWLSSIQSEISAGKDIEISASWLELYPKR